MLVQVDIILFDSALSHEEQQAFDRVREIAAKGIDIPDHVIDARDGTTTMPYRCVEIIREKLRMEGLERFISHIRPANPSSYWFYKSWVVIYSACSSLKIGEGRGGTSG